MHQRFPLLLWALMLAACADGKPDGNTALVVTGVPATYGTTTTESITVEVQVNDCAGGSDTDSITITFECVGE